MDAEISAETKFVTSAVQPEPDLDRMSVLAARDLDWEQVVQEAVNRHRVGPLLYRNLTESGSDELVPGRVLERLQQHSRETATRNLSMTNSLLSILERLDGAGIPALPFKGPVLSENVYADFSLRRSRDLDILVRPGDFLDAEAVLLDHGFEPERELTERQKRMLARNDRDHTLKRGGIVVELHPRISSPRPPFDVTELLERAKSVELAGDAVPAMESVEKLLVLSDHGSTHRWNQLKWICDIAYLLRNETFDWPVVLEESKRRNCYRRVLLACGLAAAVLDVGLPEVVWSGLRHREMGLIESTYPDCLLGIDDAVPLRYRLRTQDDTVDRIRYCLGELCTPPVGDADDALFPERLVELYYVIYPVRAVASKLRTTTRALVSGSGPNSR